VWSNGNIPYIYVQWEKYMYNPMEILHMCSPMGTLLYMCNPMGTLLYMCNPMGTLLYMCSPMGTLLYIEVQPGNTPYKHGSMEILPIHV
jgi:hypothetical protein